MKPSSEKSIPDQIVKELISNFIVTYVIRAVLLIAGIYLIYRIVEWTVR